MSTFFYRRKYGVETTLDFVLRDTSGVDLVVDAAHASGDTKIMKNEGGEVNTTNGFVDRGQGYSITLTQAEVQAARIVVYVVDQSTKAWQDAVLIIETYGSEGNSQHMIDQDCLHTDLDTYQCIVYMIRDTTGTPSNLYIVDFIKNGEPIVSGISSPTIQVKKVSDDTDLISQTALTERGSSGRYKHLETTNLIAKGAEVGYDILIQATIGGAARHWSQPMGRDD